MAKFIKILAQQKNTVYNPDSCVNYYEEIDRLKEIHDILDTKVSHLNHMLYARKENISNRERIRDHKSVRITEGIAKLNSAKQEISDLIQTAYRKLGSREQEFARKIKELEERNSELQKQLHIQSTPPSYSHNNTYKSRSHEPANNDVGKANSNRIDRVEKNIEQLSAQMSQLTKLVQSLTDPVLGNVPYE